MAAFGVGSHVVHGKLADLGAGEVVSWNEGTIRIRFASGDRNFVWERVAPHLVLTREAPKLEASSPSKPKRARKPKA